jgi:hypothetical protein
MNPIDPLKGATAGDTAARLGRLGRAIESALAELKQAPMADREALEYACAQIVWEYIVQREACGIVRHEDAIRMYGIPRTVVSKLGARRPSSSHNA